MVHEKIATHPDEGRPQGRLPARQFGDVRPVNELNPGDEAVPAGISVAVDSPRKRQGFSMRDQSRGCADRIIDTQQDQAERQLGLARLTIDLDTGSS